MSYNIIHYALFSTVHTFKSTHAYILNSCRLKENNNYKQQSHKKDRKNPLTPVLLSTVFYRFLFFDTPSVQNDVRDTGMTNAEVKKSSQKKVTDGQLKIIWRKLSESNFTKGMFHFSLFRFTQILL